MMSPLDFNNEELTLIQYFHGVNFIPAVTSKVQPAANKYNERQEVVITIQTQEIVMLITVYSGYEYLPEKHFNKLYNDIIQILEIMYISQVRYDRKKQEQMTNTLLFDDYEDNIHQELKYENSDDEEIENNLDDELKNDFDKENEDIDFLQEFMDILQNSDSDESYDTDNEALYEEYFGSQRLKMTVLIDESITNRVPDVSSIYQSICDHFPNIDVYLEYERTNLMNGKDVQFETCIEQIEELKEELENENSDLKEEIDELEYNVQIIKDELEVFKKEVRIHILREKFINSMEELRKLIIYLLNSCIEYEKYIPNLIFQIKKFLDLLKDITLDPIYIYAKWVQLRYLINQKLQQAQLYTSKLLIQLPLIDINIQPNLLFNQNYKNIKFINLKIPLINLKFPFLFNDQLKHLTSINYQLNVMSNKFCYRLFYHKISRSIRTYEKYQLLTYPTYFEKFNIQTLITEIYLEKYLYLNQFYLNIPKSTFILNKNQEKILVRRHHEYRMILNFRKIRKQNYFLQMALYIHNILSTVKEDGIHKLYGLFLKYLKLFIEIPSRRYSIILVILLNFILYYLQKFFQLECQKFKCMQSKF